MRNNRSLISLILLGLIIIVGWFYWTQWRPSKIRKDCSWVQRYGQKSLPRSRDQLTDQEQQILDNEPGTGIVSQVEYWHQFPSDYEYKLKYIYTPYYYWDSATDEEYKVCIRQGGI